MSLTDNRTQLQDCETATNVSGETTAAPTGLSGVTGTIIEGSDSIEFQCDDAQEVLLFDRDSAAALINVDMSDMTVYMMIKFGTGKTFANLGGLFAFGDGLDGAGGEIVGYNCVGADVSGFPYEFGFFCMKMDVSVIVASPGVVDVDFFEYGGVNEAALNHAAILQIGYGTFSLVKAVSTSPNAWCDGIYYIANDSYAVSIIGGTVGTPETMADVVSDDIAVGMGLFNNPKGSEFGFFAPTEWGAATGDTYFTSTGEQWYFIGDNQGGHAIGATHFPQQLISGTGTNSWVLNGTVLVNVGTRSEFDLSDGSFDIIEVAGGAWNGFGTIALPSSGGTSRFTRDVVFSDCDQITHNGADSTGSSVLLSTVAADVGALVYNETTDPDGELDNMTFGQGGNDHHAIDFGTNVTNDITLRGIEFSGFDVTSGEDQPGAALRFLAGSGSLNCNIVGCTVDGAAATASNLFKDDAAGIAVTLVFDPRTATFVCLDGSATPPSAIENVSVLIESSDGTGDLPFEDVVTLTQTGGTVTSAHTSHGMADGDLVIIRDAVETEYNGTFPITNVTANDYDYIIQGNPSSPATGTIIASGAVVFGRTDSNGEIADTRTWGNNQPVKGTGRKKTSPPVYETGNFTGTISNAADTVLTAIMQPD